MITKFCLNLFNTATGLFLHGDGSVTPLFPDGEGYVIATDGGQLDDP